MKYCFSTLAKVITCLLLLVFAQVCQAQYQSARDVNGNTKSIETRRAEESRNIQKNAEIERNRRQSSSSSSSNSTNRSYGTKPATESFSDKWEREAPERARREAEKKAALAEMEFLDEYAYISPVEDVNGLRLVIRKDNGRYGYFNSKNTGSICDCYTDYKLPTEGYYAMKMPILERWGFVDKHDSTMINFTYDNVLSTFKNGIAKVVLNGRTILIDKLGNEIYAFDKNPVNTKTAYPGKKPVVAVSKNKSQNFYDDGITKYQQQDFKGSISDFTNAINENPTFKEAWNQRALAKYTLANYNGAIADFNIFINLAPNNSDAYFNRGIAKLNVNDYKGAVTDMTSAISINKRSRDAYCIRASAKINLNDNAGALADYTSAITIDPWYPKAWLKRGILNANMQNFKEAISDYTKVTIMEPANSDAWFSMAGCKYNLNNYNGAIADYTKVIELKNRESVPNAYYWRGSAKLLVNDKEAACVDLRMAAYLGYTAANALISTNCK